MALAALAACVRQAPGPAVGLSEKSAGGAPTRDAGAADLVDGGSLLPANYRATFTKLNKARFLSQGHAAGRWELDVWANELAVRALAARAREVQTGAIVVAEHFERGEAQARGPIMVMEKQSPGSSKDHGDWRWIVIGSQGQLVKDGVVESCAGCHDDAPMDGLFPLAQ